MSRPGELIDPTAGKADTALAKELAQQKQRYGGYVNLLNDEWIPIRRASGSQHWIAPWQLTEGLDDDPIVSLAYPRPDLAGSMAQFLIGLLQTVTPKLSDEEDWEAHFECPPEPDTLHQWCEPWASAFELDGDGPRFMQDLDPAISERKLTSIGKLLIDCPGEKTTKDNKDHFVKRDEVSQLSVPMAAAALFALQTNAPAGGQGNRTSLRGGGPLTTLVKIDPRQPDASLWQELWLNVLDWERFASRKDQPSGPSADIFPWLADTRSSNPKAGGCSTTFADVHPLQMYWAMPRRIRLDFEHRGSGDCDLGGPAGEQQLLGCHTCNYGVNYDGPWLHPLSPHYYDKQGTPFPLHGNPGGLQYRYWLGLVQGSEKERSPAKVVSRFLARRRRGKQQFCLWAFGYDMADMTPRAWYEAQLPLYPLEDAYQRKQFEGTVGCLVEAASEVRSYLSSAVKQAWFKRPKDKKGDMSAVDLAWWRATEPGFYRQLDSLRDALLAECEMDEARDEIHLDWYRQLRACAEQQFEHWATRGELAFEDPKRIAEAHAALRGKLKGKRLRKLLDLPNKPRQQEVSRDETA